MEQTASCTKAGAVPLVSITIPSSFLPPSSPQGPAVNATLPHGTSVGEGGDVPSETNLLMAAAEMHRLGRLKPKSKAETK